MKRLIESSNRFLGRTLGLGPRGLLVLAALMVLPTYVFPLWQLRMFARQYPEGLDLYIYSYKLDGGHGGQDVNEINVLNHYIGMRELRADDFTEFEWIPFVIGIFALLFLRAAVMGRMSDLVDVTVLYVYFGLFSLWSFAYSLYRYGHDLAPNAAVKVEPFMPPLFGFEQLANFEVYSYPALASYALVGVAVALASALFIGWRQVRASS